MTTTRERALEAALQAFLRAPSPGSNGPGSVTIEVQTFNLNAARAALAMPADPAPVAAGEHTPAPWHASRHGTDAYVWGPDPTRPGCIATVNLLPSHAVTRSEREASLSVILAAPDMLAALQAIVANGFDMTEGARRVIRAAIARATGREG